MRALNLRRALIVGLALLWLSGCARTAVLHDPPPVSFFPLETTVVERAIVAAMAKLRWIPTREGPGVIRGTLHLRTHTVVVRVEYTNESYKISYVDSENMSYAQRKDGTKLIHK